jgi:hypothetical protein
VFLQAQFIDWTGAYVQFACQLPTSLKIYWEAQHEVPKGGLSLFSNIWYEINLFHSVVNLLRCGIFDERSAALIDGERATDLSQID